MRYYLTNFINNIKRICINIKYVLCYDFYKLFNTINNTAQNNKANILGQGTMSIGTTMMATLGAGMLTAGSGGGLAPVLASGFAMFAMEGGGEYIESYMYHSQDKLVDKVQHDKDLQDFKNNYINVNGKKYSELPYMQQKPYQTNHNKKKLKKYLTFI